MSIIIRTSTTVLIAAVLVAGCGLLTDPPDPPAAPSALLASARSMTEISLTWMAPDGELGGPVSRYELERATGSAAFEVVAEPGADAGSYMDTGLSAEQRYRYQLRACNEGGCSEFTSTTAANTFGVLDVTTSALPGGAVGQPYTAGLSATGAGEDYSWSIVSGSLPAGLVLDDTIGTITGTPTTEQTSQFTVQARSIDGQTATADLAIDVAAALPVEILNVALPPGLIQGEYEATLRSSGGGAETTWSVVSGTLPSGLSIDPAGRIIGTPTATDTVTIRLRAESAGESDEADYALKVVDDRTGGYDITTVDVSSVPPELQPHVDSAVARWERVLTGDASAVAIPAGQVEPTDCGGFGDALDGTTLDDIIVLINIAPIDGPGNTLGRAGPCLIRSGGADANLPVAGFLTLDVEDLDATEVDRTVALVFHEIGHILGFGTLWNLLSLISGAGTAQPLYTGTQAVAEYNDLGETGDIPLENQGGAGTRDSHWRESIFETEVMTGFSEPPGTPQPLSRMTIASMEDLGYTADRNQADPFTLAMALSAGGGAAAGYDEVYAGPVLFITPDGRVRPDPR